jgi:hypothetical protein
MQAVSDHLGYGCKTGTPYVSCERPSVTAANADMEKEYKGVKFQKEVNGGACWAGGDVSSM